MYDVSSAAAAVDMSWPLSPTSSRALPSARAFAAALQRQAALARRYDRPGALILVGSAQADDPGCRAVASALRERLRATDLLARTSGCEFAVLLPDARATEARELAGELVGLASRAAGLPAAAGIACSPTGSTGPAGALLADADAALAGARGAVPPVAVYEARVSRPPRAGGSLAERLRRALDDPGLVLERAPVVDVHSGAVDHRAVVARLPGAEGGLLERAERFGSLARSIAAPWSTRSRPDRRSWWCRSRPARPPTGDSPTGWSTRSARARARA